MEFYDLLTKKLDELIHYDTCTKTLLGLGLFVIISSLYYFEKFSFWSRRNVNYPTPIPFFGNYLALSLRNYQDVSIEWFKKYGKVYGYYSGSKPHLVIADVEILKQICIKDFDKFPNHQFDNRPNKYQERFMIVQKDDIWRAMRGLMSPSFATSKLKGMYPILDKCIEESIESLKRNSNQKLFVIDAKSLSGSLSMGSAISCFYGIKLDDTNSESPNSKQLFFKKTSEAIEPSLSMLLITSILPKKILEIFDIVAFPPKKMDFLFDKANEIIKHRLNTGSSQTKDFLHLLLEARVDTETAKPDSELNLAHYSTGADDTTKLNVPSRPPKLKLTEIEVACQVVMLMIVATETTSCLISHTIYLLAHHKDIQKRLFDELSSGKIQNENGKLDYDKLQSHEYLDCVISESLRLMPPALRMDREANEDYVFKGLGFQIPKGTTIYLDYYAILRDPDYWPEPERFDPERFNALNKPKIVAGAFCPFGVGPRFCIGYRFALAEAKIALAKMVQCFQFDPAPGTVYPPSPKKPAFLVNDYKNLLVSLKER